MTFFSVKNKLKLKATLTLQKAYKAGTVTYSFLTKKVKFFKVKVYVITKN